MVYIILLSYRIHSEMAFAAEIEWRRHVAVICINTGAKHAPCKWQLVKIYLPDDAFVLHCDLSSAWTVE